jgi:hypothetical protein
LGVFRLGCFGCLTMLMLLALVGFAGWGILQAASAPDIAAPPTTAVDGQRAQQKIFDLMRRAGSGRPHSVTLTEAEVNAFLGRHLAGAAELPLQRLSVRLPSDGHAAIAGQIPLRRLLGETSMIGGLMPESWMDERVWLSFDARATLETTEARRARRHLRLDVDRFAIGRLRLPSFLLRVLLDPSALRLLRWQMPDAIDGIRIEPGRLVIQSAS